MMRERCRAGAVAALALAGVAASTAALAGGFAVREQSATAQGLSFAGAASGSGAVSSMFWNPATITMAPGFVSEYHLSGVIPEAKIKPTVGTLAPLVPLGPSGDIGQDAIVPASYTSYQLSDQFWVGLATSSPFGLVTKPHQVWAGQVYSRSSKIFTLNANLVLAYKVNDWLTIAGGPMVEYFDVRLKRAVSPSPSPAAAGLALTPAAGTAILDGDATSMGFTAGILLTPRAGTTIGVGYRSAVTHSLDGWLKLPYTGFPISAQLTTPDQVTVGVSQAITPALTVHGGFEWTNWSRLGNPAVVGGFTGIATSLPLNYKDGYFYALGLDYALSERWTLRGGIAYEQSPIDDQIRATRLPDNDRIWASIGASYKWNEKLSFDLAYTHIFVRDTRISIFPGHQDYVPPVTFAANVDSKVDIISAALRYRWDDPKTPIPAAPVVRKY